MTRSSTRIHGLRMFDSASSSRPYRKTVKTMMIRRARCLIERAAPMNPAPCAQPAARQRAQGRGDEAAEARQFTRRRIADQSGQIVLDLPAQVLEQPVDVAGEGRIAGNVDLRAFAGQTPDHHQGRIRRVDGDPQVGRLGRRLGASCHSSRPAGRDQKRQWRNRRQQAGQRSRCTTMRRPLWLFRR